MPRLTHKLEHSSILSDSLSFTASFTVTGPITTREADGLLELCVSVINGNNITDIGAAIRVLVVDQTTESNAPSSILIIYFDVGLNSFFIGEDYRLEQNIVTFTRERTSGCISITLIQDGLVESTEAMLVRITAVSPQFITTIEPDILTVIIEDSDSELKLNYVL